MSLKIVAIETFRVGRPVVVDADSPVGRYATVFEDDGETGVFYAVDTDVEDGNPVQDALLVYMTNQFYNPKDEGRLPYDDPSINYDWETQKK